MFICRLGLFSAEDRCFVTFESDPLIIPNLGTPYNLYYAPNTSVTGKREGETGRGRYREREI